MKKPKNPKAPKKGRPAEEMLSSASRSGKLLNLSGDYEDFLADDGPSEAVIVPHGKPKKDYEVGRGRPPKHTQFKKGKSGNPGGRPKGVKNIRTLIHEIAAEEIPIKTPEGIRKMSINEAAARKFLAMLLKGDLKHFKEYCMIQEQEFAKIDDIQHEESMKEFRKMQALVDGIIAETIDVLSAEQ